MIQSKERIILMETNSPASTNGAFMLSNDKRQARTITIPILIDIDSVPQMRRWADLVQESDVINQSVLATVNVDWDTRTETLTHASVTGAYANYQSIHRMRQENILPFPRWLEFAMTQARFFMSKSQRDLDLTFLETTAS
jgi:hypothetical protein